MLEGMNDIDGGSALINDLNSDGMTVVLTTHNMEEAEYLCDRIAIMDQGKIVA